MCDFLQIFVCYISGMSNFLFLKKNNEDLFSIISEAENLFRDEYFEQSVVQIRRFAENLCKDILQDKVSVEDTFDSMINKVKDNSFGNIRMKEFADDLYFLKKHGNVSAHSSFANKNDGEAGKTALECLERAYEISVFYHNVKYGYDKKIDKTVFSEELLMTGKMTGKTFSPKMLKERYSDELKKNREQTSKIKRTRSVKVQKTKTSSFKPPAPRINATLQNVFLFAAFFFLFAAMVLLFQFFLTKTYILNSAQSNVIFAPHQIKH